MTTLHVRRTDELISRAVVDAISTASGRPPTALEPLANSVDPDALDALLRMDTSGRVRFRHAGYTVTVDADGDEVTVHVEDRAELT